MEAHDLRNVRLFLPPVGEEHGERRRRDGRRVRIAVDDEDGAATLARDADALADELVVGNAIARGACGAGDVHWGRRRESLPQTARPLLECRAAAWDLLAEVR